MKKKIREIMLSVTGSIVMAVIIWLLVILAVGISAHADGQGYDRIEQTESREVIALTEAAAEIYPVCPELLQAVIFYESSNRADARNGRCTGYMQIDPEYHRERADRLGVSLYDGWGNILTGTDYLAELCEEYGDIAAALMVYHGERDAAAKAEAGEISIYAGKILELSAKLERLHKK